MLTAIVQHSAELIAFINALNIVLYQPQIRHLIQIVDALLTSSETKTISGPRKRWMVMTFLEMARKVNVAFEIFICVC